MAEKIIELTEQRKAELEKELEFLKVTKRDEIKKAIEEARGQGDLSENADYSSAREAQSKNEARISEIEEMLKHARIIQATNIVVKYTKINKEFKFKISGAESDPANGKISSESPLAKAVMVHEKGDKFVITTEQGKDIEVELIDKD